MINAFKKGDFVAVDIVSSDTFGGTESDCKLCVVERVLHEERRIEVMHLPWGKEYGKYARFVESVPMEDVHPAESVWSFMKGFSVNYPS